MNPSSCAASTAAAGVSAKAEGTTGSRTRAARLGRLGTKPPDARSSIRPAAARFTRRRRAFRPGARPLVHPPHPVQGPRGSSGNGRPARRGRAAGSRLRHRGGVPSRTRSAASSCGEPARIAPATARASIMIGERRGRGASPPTGSRATAESPRDSSPRRRTRSVDRCGAKPPSRARGGAPFTVAGERSASRVRSDERVGPRMPGAAGVRDHDHARALGPAA